MNKLIAIVCLTCVVTSATCSAQSSGGSALEREDTGTSDLARVEDLGYETIRFYTRNSKPENIKSYAFSPNGRYLALSFDRDNLGARSGLSIVDLEQKQLTKTTGHYSFYSMAFDSNSQRVLALGGYAGLQVYDLTTNSLREIRNPRYTAGKIGIDIEEHNGKLVISRVLRDFNPTIGDQIKVGDEIVSSSLFDANTFRDLKFSPDSRQVLAGTRDSIEIFDTVTEKWLAPVVLTPKDDADAGRLVTRRIPLGLGFPGDFFMTANEVVFDKPAALATFDVSPSGVLAIGSEDGRIVIASLGTKVITAELGERILGGVPEMVEFSPDGKHLVGFAKGMLHIFDIVDGSRPANVERLSSIPR